MTYLVIVVLLLLILGVLIKFHSRHLHKESGLPPGEIIYQDTRRSKKKPAQIALLTNIPAGWKAGLSGEGKQRHHTS